MPKESFTATLPKPLSAPSHPAKPFHIVAVGASAGGLDLSPDFESLGRQTTIPIHRVHDGLEVEPNAIYLIPPKKEMVISGGRLLLTDKEPGHGFRLPTDHFFRSLVRSIAEAHDGEVKAHSAGPGAGAPFDVRLPLDAKRVSDGLRRVSARKGSRTLVLVEDEVDSREMLASLLEYKGFRVVTADDGKTGVEAILRHEPAIAVVDIGLPVTTGYEVARTVRKKLGREGIYLIALTGYGQQTDREAVLEAGFDQHLVKPVQIDVLLELLNGETRD